MSVEKYYASPRSSQNIQQAILTVAAKKLASNKREREPCWAE